MILIFFMNITFQILKNVKHLSKSIEMFEYPFIGQVVLR